jgi:hypothetical protein
MSEFQSQNVLNQSEEEVPTHCQYDECMRDPLYDNCDTCQAKPVIDCVDCEVPFVMSDLDGKIYHCDCEPFVWNVNHAFEKFGFNDGDSDRNYTNEIAQCIREIGYEVECDGWGCHNYVITKITRKSDGVVVYGDEGDLSLSGYYGDTIGNTLPRDIFKALFIYELDCDDEFLEQILDVDDIDYVYYDEDEEEEEVRGPYKSKYGFRSNYYRIFDCGEQFYREKFYDVPRKCPCGDCPDYDGKVGTYEEHIFTISRSDFDKYARVFIKENYEKLLEKEKKRELCVFEKDTLNDIKILQDIANEFDSEDSKIINEDDEYQYRWINPHINIVG